MLSRVFKVKLFFIILFFPSLAQSLISIDANTTATRTGAWGTTASWLHTTGSCFNRVMVLTTGEALACSVTAVSYGGSSFTQAVSVSDTASRSQIWYLVAPATGATNVTVTVSAAANFLANLVTYCECNQASPIGVVGGVTSSATSLAITKTTTTENSWLLMAAMGFDPMASSGMTADTAVLGVGAGGGAINSVHAYKSTTSVGSYVVNATGSASNNNVMTMAELKSDMLTPTPTPTATSTPTWTRTVTVLSTASFTRTRTFTITKTTTRTHTPTATRTRTNTFTVTKTPTPTPTLTATPNGTFTATPTATVSPTITQTHTFTFTRTTSPTPTPTASLSKTPFWFRRETPAPVTWTTRGPI